jgi:predicted Zn-dependent protease
VLTKERIGHDPAANEVVREVGERIARAAEKPDYHWEFTVIDDPKQANALARHAGERMSQGLLLQIAGTGLSVALGAESSAAQSAIMQAFGLGAQVGVVLPFNRSQEA